MKAALYSFITMSEVILSSALTLDFTQRKAHCTSAINIYTFSFYFSSLAILP